MCVRQLASGARVIVPSLTLLLCVAYVQGSATNKRHGNKAMYNNIYLTCMNVQVKSLAGQCVFQTRLTGINVVLDILCKRHTSLKKAHKHYLLDMLPLKGL